MKDEVDVREHGRRQLIVIASAIPGMDYQG